MKVACIENFKVNFDMWLLAGLNNYYYLLLIYWTRRNFKDTNTGSMLFNNVYNCTYLGNS